MNLEQMRALCLSFPHATEQIQWGADLVLKVGGKMFAVAATEPGEVKASFKVTPEQFAELTEVPGVIPAPYLARAKWIAVERWDALRHEEFADLLRGSYALVFASLPAGMKKKLGGEAEKSKGSRKKSGR